MKMEIEACSSVVYEHWNRRLVSVLTIDPLCPAEKDQE